MYTEYSNPHTHTHTHIQTLTHPTPYQTKVRYTLRAPFMRLFYTHLRDAKVRSPFVDDVAIVIAIAIAVASAVASAVAR